jgi:serine/threonine protein kinase
MDFGIAAMIGDQDPAETMQGTPVYMSPERLQNKSAAETGDVFSLGMLLYEMLAGRPAVTGSSTFEIMHKIANEPFVPPSRINPDVDEHLDDIVLKALLKNDSERYESAAAMKQALEEYLAPAADIEQAPGGAKGTLDFPAAAHAPQDRFSGFVANHQHDQPHRRGQRRKRANAVGRAAERISR